MNLSELLRQGESETLEFKASFNDDVLESLGALANARGGIVLIGVEDAGVVRGVQVGKKTLEDWANRIQEATDPRLQPSISKVERNGKTLVTITVESTTGVPVSVRGRYFRRVGRTNQRMSHKEIMQRILSGAGLSWDAVGEPEASWDDLALEKIRQFMDAVRHAGRRPVPERTGEREFLEKLELLKDGRLTRAALLLFGKRPTSYFPSAFLKLGRFRSPILIVDDREVEGTLLEQVEEAMSWFRERFQTKFVITGKPQRDTIWEYPLEAVREAVVNAICHRDYASPINIQVRLYDDRLTIWNPGELLFPLTPTALLHEHASIPRNRKVAEAFFYVKLIEQWGSGTTRMAAMLQEAGLPEPEFDIRTPGMFRLTLRQDPFSEERLQELGLNERQRQAVAYVREKGRITNQEYRQLTGVSNKTAYLDLNGLVDKQVLAVQGTRRSISYVLSKSWVTKR
ncbi:MAG: putative DNA binding domain-containing protein [Deltaproteobacteria bacterium]|nr:putative DNA binding domain-containing protein [Deltaproteobacteria bacterium]